MDSLALSLCLSILLATVGAEEEFAQDEFVFELTDKNFDSFLEKYPTCMVEFYAPWCGHCKTLAPEYNAAARTLKTHESVAVLAKVDATAELETAKKFKIEGFPTMKFWKDGEVTDYDGAREHAAIVTWIRERTEVDYKPPPEVVLTLTTENFKSVTSEQELMLVEFYAPWCGHCKQLAPEYEKAAAKLQTRDPPILLAKVDATVEKDLAKDFGVAGYPTLKVMRSGKHYDYKGPRDANGIATFMADLAAPAAKELKNVKEVQRLMSKDDVTVLGFFATSRDPLLESFKGAGESLREEYKFIGYSTEPTVLSHFKTQAGRIGVYQPERFYSKYEPKVKFIDTPDASSETLVKFITDNTIPLVGHRTHPNMGLRFSHRPLVVAYFTVDFSLAHIDGTQYWRNKVLKIANEYKDSPFKFAISDEDEFAKELTEVGLGDSAQDVNVVVFGKDGRKYPLDPEVFDDDFSEDTFTEFMEMINSGKAKPHVKSQPAPKDDKGPIKTVVASTFDRIVRDESKDVLVEFYAPWCGHCKNFESEYEKLARQLKNEKNLVLTKMDSTANDSPNGFEVQGFPTIYFAPSGKKSEPVKYEGNRDLADLTKFMKENAVKSFQKTEL